MNSQESDCSPYEIFRRRTFNVTLNITLPLRLLNIQLISFFTSQKSEIIFHNRR